MDGNWSTTTPPPSPVRTAPKLEAQLKRLQDHVKAAVTDRKKQQQLLAYNFDPQVIGLLSVLPPTPQADLLLGAPVPETYSGPLFDTTGVSVAEVFGNETTLEKPSIKNALVASLPLSCGWTDRAVLSTNHGIVENVVSPQACQHLCQASLTTMDWSKCREHANDKSSVVTWLLHEFISTWYHLIEDHPVLGDQEPIQRGCEAITYLPHSRTCVLHEQVEGVFHLPGTYSALAVCEGGSIALTGKLYEEARTHADCMKAPLKRIRFFDEQVLTKIEAAATWSHKFFIPKLNLTKAVSDTLAMKWTNYQLYEPRALLGELTFVNSVPSCMALCLADENCAFWNWLAIGSNSLVCYKSHNFALTLKPLILPQNGVNWFKGGSGSREAIPFELTEALSTAVMEEAKSHASAAVQPMKKDCVFTGFMGYSDVIEASKITEYRIWKSYVRSLEWFEPLSSPRECARACEMMFACRAWEYRKDSCGLFSAEFPRLLPTLNSDVTTGFSRFGASLVNSPAQVSFCLDKVPQPGVLALYNSNVTRREQLESFSSNTNKETLSLQNAVLKDPALDAPTFTLIKKESKHESFQSLACHSAYGVRLPLTSINGRLIESTHSNTRIVDTSTACLQQCQMTDNCLGWTYGTWGGCYLYDKIDNLISDSSTISGIPNCVSVVSAWLVLPSDTQSKIVRQFPSCINVRHNVVFTKGMLIDQFPNKFDSPDNCWQSCRLTNGCLSATYLDSYPVNETASSKAAHPTNCILFGDVDESSITPHRRAVFMNSNCDFYGESRFGSPEVLGKSAFSKEVFTICFFVAIGIVTAAAWIVMAKSRRIANYRARRHAADDEAQIATGLIR